MALRIGIVAGEASGDLLGAAIISALRQYYPDLIIEGVAGPKMLSAGATTLFPMEKLSVMGFSEVILRARELLNLRNSIKQHFLNKRPDIYIGIDSPDFNLPIELALKSAGIKTVHCNSPTIWAWRKNRIKKIAKSVDLMLTLFPFEASYYQAENIPVCYIGHPLADQIPLEIAKQKARQQLNLPENSQVIALLPGSRAGEIKYIGPILLRAALVCWKKKPDLIFISPMINTARYDQFYTQWQQIAPELPLKVFNGQSQTVMAAADMIALASGTATLEAMLFKKPMVVTYKASLLSYLIAKQLIKIPFVSLPNILANEKLVPEILQYDATPENIANEILKYNNNPEQINLLTHKFTEIHKQLRCNASAKAAAAIHDLLQGSLLCQPQLT